MTDIMETVTVRKYWDDEQTKLMSEYNEFNGKKTSEYKIFFENGNLHSVYNYENRVLKNSKEYNPDGGLSCINDYIYYQNEKA